MFEKVSAIKNAVKVVDYVRQTAYLMMGVSDYKTYVRCFKEKHPNQKPMSYTAFFRECQESRYNRKIGWFVEK